MPPTILCAIANDNRLKDVVATGRALAATGRFSVLFVHVAQPAIAPPSAPGLAAGGVFSATAAHPPGFSFDELVERARAGGERLLRGARVQEQESIVVAGEPVTELNRLAIEHDAALVVVGTHGRGALSRTLLGSVSQALARDGARPVLVARRGLLPKRGGPVVCGVDIADERALRPVTHAARLATSMQRPMVLVHVLNGNQVVPGAGPVAAPMALEPLAQDRAEARRALETLGRRTSIERVESVVVHGTSVALHLDELAACRGADLLVVGCRGAGLLRRALEGSVSLDLLRDGRRPLVIVPPG